ncbi:phosphatidylglycerol specific phospholipase [Penicillium maclennaniae]|uniref:phosphatidylglycerol specific phospholipase n=1 Tax=Penicillium maclennaniae TaxID=1343394 RepID=UPI002540FEB0|nr:phosphatidylglycerol specific phospholipase [Penicillium maclennaniae]KAJ5675004.1 phosphatidylglycerol specific phospholipase [Penicillium maclennaniae]
MPMNPRVLFHNVVSDSVYLRHGLLVRSSRPWPWPWGRRSPYLFGILVVLGQENGSFDTLAGGFTYNPNIDGLVNQKYCNPANVSVPSTEDICAAGIAKTIASISTTQSLA